MSTLKHVENNDLGFSSMHETKGSLLTVHSNLPNPDIMRPAAVQVLMCIRSLESQTILM